jgi:hypothetical protein
MSYVPVQNFSLFNAPFVVGLVTEAPQRFGQAVHDGSE